MRRIGRELAATPEGKARLVAAGKSGKGRRKTEEWKAKMRGRKYTDEQRANISEGLRKAWERRQAVKDLLPVAEAPVAPE